MTEYDDVNTKQGRLVTQRELELIALVATGLTDKAIGYKCKISLQTVKNLLQSARSKLDLHNRVELTVWYLKSQNGKDITS